MSGTFYLQNMLGGLAFGGLLFTIAAGLSLIFGLMRVVNIAQTSFYLLGAYTGLSLLAKGVNFWLAAVLAGVAVSVIGILLYRVILHHFHQEELTSLLLTLGMSLVIQDVSLAIWGGDPRSISAPAAIGFAMRLGNLVFPAYWLVLIGVGGLAGAGLWAFQRFTMLGAIIRAGVDDGEMLRGLGVNVNRAFYVVFMLGAFLSGMGGLLGGPITGVYPGLDVELIPLAFAVVIVGGMGSLSGAFVGSLIIGVANTFGRAMFPQLSYFTIFVPVVLIMAFKPQGLFGRTELGS